MVRTEVRYRRRRAVLGISVLVVGLWAGAGARAGGAEQGQERHAVRYVVRPGDSLWSVAARFSPPGADPRPLVDALARSSGGEVLRPGQVLTVPVS